MHIIRSVFKTLSEQLLFKLFFHQIANKNVNCKN